MEVVEGMHFIEIGDAFVVLVGKAIGRNGEEAQ